MKVLFQGDSITDGNHYRQEGDLNHQIGHSYAYVVCAELGYRYPQYEIKFVNKGFSGNRTGDLLARWQTDALDVNPDVLCLLVGINDSCYPPEEEQNDPDVTPSLSRYRQLLSLTREYCPNTKIVLMEPFSLYLKQDNIRTEISTAKARLAGLQKGIRELAAEFGTEFIPLQHLFTEKGERNSMRYWVWDGVHPTEAGHGLIAHELIPVLEKIMELKP